MQLLGQLLQAASTEHTCTLILLRTETGTAIPAIGEDRKAEPDARPLQALRLPGQEKMEGSIASPRLEPARQRQRLIVLEPNARRPELCRRTWLMQKRRSRTPDPRTWSRRCLQHSAVWLERFTEQGLLDKQRKIEASIMAHVLRIFIRLVGLWWSGKCMYRIAHVVR